LQARQLEVEISEDSLMSNLDETNKQLKLLRRIGVRIALDDFGLGQCSLAHLRDLEFDTLKLDPQLVARLPGSVRDAAMARSIIQLCGHFDVLVIAEGVETLEQAQWLKANGCSFVQGPWAAQPLIAEEVADWSHPRLL
jgi:EAL domain-containing protein (putative c-di-GMP-specific phosphodiesterase class I)